MKRTILILAAIFLSAGFVAVFATPEREVHLSEDFLGSNESGDTYYTLKEVGDNTGTYYSTRDSTILVEYKLGVPGESEKVETLLTGYRRYYPDGDTEKPRHLDFHHHAADVELDDLLTSNTVLRFKATETGLQALRGKKEWQVLSSTELKNIFAVTLALREKEVQAHRARNYFYIPVYGASTSREYMGSYAYVDGTFVLPVPAALVLEPTSGTLTHKSH